MARSTGGVWRRGWDSNPRCFRTPLFESGTINHSDTSPRRGYQRVAARQIGGTAERRARPVAAGHAETPMRKTRGRDAGAPSQPAPIAWPFMPRASRGQGDSGCDRLDRLRIARVRAAGACGSQPRCMGEARRGNEARTASVIDGGDIRFARRRKVPGAGPRRANYRAPDDGAGSASSSASSRRIPLTTRIRRGRASCWASWMTLPAAPSMRFGAA